jgi:dolichyl-phosphate-mannose--protein O-mannosyl transferase
MWVYALAVLFLFAMFYPILSGETVSRFYVARFLRWLPSWTFFI